jgi:hypothetical protein
VNGGKKENKRRFSAELLASEDDEGYLLKPPLCAICKVNN